VNRNARDNDLRPVPFVEEKRARHHLFIQREHLREMPRRLTFIFMQLSRCKTDNDRCRFASVLFSARSRHLSNPSREFASVSNLRYPYLRLRYRSSKAGTALINDDEIADCVSRCEYVSVLGIGDRFSRGEPANRIRDPLRLALSPPPAPVAAYLTLATNNAGLVLNSTGMRKIDRQETAVRLDRRVSARIPSIDGRARINDDQIHHKVKGPQWLPLAALVASCR